MKFKMGLSVVGVVASAAVQVAWADSSALMTSAEATSQQSEGVSSPSSGSDSQGAQGISRAGLLTDVVGGHVPVRISDFTMLMGPSMNNFSSNAPSAQAPFSGFSLRHDLKVDYSLSDRVTIGPSFDVTENLYSSSQGSLIFNDPSIRLAITDVNQAWFGNATLKSSLWLQVYAPASQLSQQMHEYTGFSAAYIPVVHFRKSRFFMSGVASVKVNLMDNQAETGMIAPIQFVSALQGHYKASRVVTFFLMDHVNTSAGPHMSLPPQDIAPDNFKRKAKMAQATSALVTDGVMTGAQFEVNSSVCISPRVDWQINQPFNTTTVGLNASFHII